MKVDDIKKIAKVLEINPASNKIIFISSIAFSREDADKLSSHIKNNNASGFNSIVLLDAENIDEVVKLVDADNIDSINA